MRHILNLPALKRTAVAMFRLAGRNTETYNSPGAPGMTCAVVPVAMFRDIAKSLKGKTVDVEVDVGGRLTLNGVTVNRKHGQADLPTPPPTADVPLVWEIDGPAGRDALRKVFPAISSEESRFQLSGAPIRL